MSKNKNLTQTIKAVADEHGYSEQSIRDRLSWDYHFLKKRPKFGFFLDSFTPKKGDVFLDVGCFVGTHIHILAAKYPEVTFLGYDISELYIDVAKAASKSKNAKFVCKDVFKASEIKENSVDHIFFMEVLEHVNNPREFLELFAKILKPGGKLYLSTPSALGIRNILLNIKNQNLHYIECEPWDTGTEKDHIYVWDKLTLYRLLFRSGFHKPKLHVSNFWNPFWLQSLCFVVEKR